MTQPTTTKTNEEVIKRRQKTRKIVFIILIVVLTMINGLLLVINYEGQKEREKLVVKLRSTETLKNQLETDYNKISAELNEYRGKGAQFDSLLAEAKTTIDKQKAKIEYLIKKGKVTNAEYAKAKQQLEELKLARDKFVSQIDSLEKINKSLLTENKSLKQTLDSEKENVKKLLTEKELLAQKVALGSILKAQNVTATSIRDRNGNEVTTTNVKRADRIKICFEIDENKVAEKGEKKLLLRIINPGGSCLTEPTQGSGTFKVIETGEVKEYSIPSLVNFDNQRISTCVYWKKSKAFGEGKYLIEIYHEGYLIGKASFELKSGLL